MKIRHKKSSKTGPVLLSCLPGELDVVELEEDGADVLDEVEVVHELGERGREVDGLLLEVLVRVPHPLGEDRVFEAGDLPNSSGGENRMVSRVIW